MNICQISTTGYNKIMKKTIIFALLLSSLGSMFLISQCFAEKIEISNPLNATTVVDLIDGIINYIWLLGIVAAPLVIIIGGFMLLTSGGSPTKLEQAKKVMLYGIIGFAIILTVKGLIALIKGVLGVKETVFYLGNIWFG